MQRVYPSLHQRPCKGQTLLNEFRPGGMQQRTAEERRLVKRHGNRSVEEPSPVSPPTVLPVARGLQTLFLRGPPSAQQLHEKENLRTATRSCRCWEEILDHVLSLLPRLDTPSRHFYSPPGGRRHCRGVNRDWVGHLKTGPPLSRS